MSMNPNRFRNRVLMAGAIVVVLAGFLSARLVARSRAEGSGLAPAAGTAVVPAAKAMETKRLDVPCWSCPSAKNWPVTFQTDLDLLAPLGAGEQNAGLWYKDFAKPDGPRFDEAVAMMERRFDHAGRSRQDCGG